MDYILLLASRFSGVVGKIVKYSEHAIYVLLLNCQPSILATVVFDGNFVLFHFFLFPVYTTDF